MTDTPIVCGKPAKYLSDVVERVQYYDAHMWVVGEVSAFLSTSKEAYALAREWYPHLEDDE